MTKTSQKDQTAVGAKTPKAAASKRAVSAAAIPVAAASVPAGEWTCVVGPAISPATGTKSKQEIVVELLRRDEGASISQLVEATGWQKHSVRGMMSGALKKKLGLQIVKMRSGDTTTYRIVAADSEVANAG